MIGCHVFAEKPLGITIEECSRIYRTVQEHTNQLFLVGFVLRYSPFYRKVRILVWNKIGTYLQPPKKEEEKALLEFTIKQILTFFLFLWNVFVLLTFLNEFKVKEIVSSGAIGQIVSFEANELVPPDHGYFFQGGSFYLKLLVVNEKKKKRTRNHCIFFFQIIFL